jgi:NADPH:quinone reductase-like Zn-dependent oxidoreductase
MLVHSAGGGVGIAATQIAKRLGARVIGTASAGKHEALRKLGVDHCIDYTREDFETSVRELTHGRGVELILDASGPSFKKSVEVRATGLLACSGSAAATEAAQLPGLARAPDLAAPRAGPMDRTRAFAQRGHLWDESDRVRLEEELLHLYREGSVKPVVAASFAFSEAPKAHHYIQDRKNFGKVLLVP